MAERPPITLPHQLVPANIDPRVRPIVWNKDGSYSTVRSMSFTDRDGKEVLIPTVIDQGKGAFIATEDQAVDHYRATGEHLGKFSHIDPEFDPGQLLHEALAAEYDHAYGDMNRLRPAAVKAGARYYAPNIGTTKGYVGGKRAQLTAAEMLQMTQGTQASPYATN